MTEEETISSQPFLILSEKEHSRIEYLNNTACNFFGIEDSSPGQVLPDFYKKYLHPEDYPVYLDHLDHISGEEDTQITLRVKDKDGNWRPCIFRDRLYKAGMSDDKSLVLSVGAPAERDKNCPKDPENLTSLKNEYETLVHCLDEAFCIVEIIYDENQVPVDCLFLKTNPAFEELCGFEKPTGRTIGMFFPVPSKEWLKKADEVAKIGSSIRFRFYSENLKNRWLDQFIFKVGEPGSRRTGILFRDITYKINQEAYLKEELARRHKALQGSNELLQTVFNTTNLAIAVLKAVKDEQQKIKDFVFIRANNMLRELYPDQDILERSYRETSPLGVTVGVLEAYRQVMLTGEALDKEFNLGKKDQENWFRITARAQQDMLITTLEDITERKAKARELEETIRFKRELVRATPEVIMIFNLNTFTIRYINKDILTENGMTREAMLEKPLQELIPFIHPRDREKALVFHRKLLKATPETILDVEVRLKINEINWEWYNVRGKIFKRKDETWVDEYVLLVRNITEQKNTQKALLNAEKLSIQGDIARTFAHELRNPLASISMVGEVLHGHLKGGLNKDLSHYFEILKRSTHALNDLLTELLTSSNYTPSILKEDNLVEIMDRTLEKAADRIYLSGMKVIKSYRGKYPVYADREKLEIALLNIIVNASEATVPGEGEIEIEILEEESDLILKISDNGQGMTQEQIDHLFEAFYTKKDKGLGIGMSSVRNILEEHDATINVDSAPGKGSTFSVFFPNTFHNSEKDEFNVKEL